MSPTPGGHDDPARFVLRAASPDDIDDLERFAAASAYGITTLPADRAALLERLSRSAQAFASPDDASGEELYLFVVEDLASGRVVGTSGISASAGDGGPHYCYRNEYVVHASAALAASNRMHTLQLCHDLTGVTLLTSFYIEPEYEATLAPQLLSRARLLFIRQFSERFAERVAAESPGLADGGGQCPFWAAVGERFFGMDYPSAERLAVGRSRRFIAELMPQAPLYVALLPRTAQWAIGQLHPVAALPFAILQDEGFDPDTYVDLFDAGPIVDGRLNGLRSAAGSRLVAVDEHAAAADGEKVVHLVASTTRTSFRAGLALLAPGQAAADAETAARCGVAPGGQLRVAPLAPAQGEGHA